MEELFDKLAKDVSGKVSRREAFGRFGWGFAVAVFASLGLARAKDGQDCVPKCCELACRANRPPGEPTPGECMRDCLNGVGDSGPICAGQCAA
jgi:hypothetical protein